MPAGPDPAPVLGVDGCRGAWVAARVAARVEGSGRVEWSAGRFAALLSAEDAVVAVDIPVGLMASGRRTCDLAGRAALGGAASRLSLTPPRFAMDAATLAEANTRLRAAGEPGVSAQAWALRAAVAEVDLCAEDSRIVEAHPELSFLAAAGRVLPPKRTARGVADRLTALNGWVDLPRVLSAAPPGVPVDDALDALVLAWTAARVRDGSAIRRPPDQREHDDRNGRQLVISS
jgi:predicted RNase H-like nuclease